MSIHLIKHTEHSLCVGTPLQPTATQQQHFAEFSNINGSAQKKNKKICKYFMQKMHFSQSKELQKDKTKKKSSKAKAKTYTR